jgi:glycosyltransferase involved in cell wall biosynthesis
VSDERLRDLYSGCRALLFPGEEDFGIIPLEAMSCGRPAIAFGKGGALETTVDGRTGLLFKEQSPESLAEAINRFEKMSFSANDIRSHAQRFSRPRFRDALEATIERTIAESRLGRSLN